VVSTPKTLVRWQDTLADRIPQTLERGTAGAPRAGSVSAQPTLYEVEVSAEGVPMHCILLDSSGDPSSDEAGNIWIHAQRFLPADQASWGRVLILWGGVSGAAASNPSETPTPSVSTP
jgi:hypothetical protein